jgi:hypothetical protein
MEWMISILVDLVRAYWWLLAPAAIVGGATLSGLAAPVVMWFEDTHIGWVGWASGR